MKKTIAVLFSLSIGVAISSEAAIYYVRDGGPTANCGTNWTNACDHISNFGTLERGATYYVASGNYAAYTITQAVVGSQTITIKKATDGEHGTDSGWIDSHSNYGLGQATWNSALFFRGTGYIVFDGAFRNELDWFDGASYGFRIYHNGNNNLIKVGEYATGTASSNLVIKHVFLDGRVAADSGNSIDTYVANTGISKNLVFTRLYVRGGCNNWFMRNATDGTIEYSAASDAMGDTASHHGEVINLYWGSDNFTVRFNKIRNSYLTGGGTAIVSVDGTNNLKFYGNVIWNFEAGNGVIGPIRATNSVVYGNTIVDNKGSSAGLDLYGTNNYVYNNLWVGNKSAYIHTGSPGAHDYNAYSSGSNDAGSESHAQLSVPTSIFSSYANKVYTLATNTQPGINLTSAPGYESDMSKDINGFPRTTWSRGAYEYGSTVIIKNSHPADTGPGGTPDNKIDPDEATIFGACWKSNCDSDATMNNAVRAGTLWNASADGEYEYNLSAGACPLCWVVVP